MRSELKAKLKYLILHIFLHNQTNALDLQHSS